MIRDCLNTAAVGSAERIRVTGCPVDRLSFKETVAELCRRIDTGIQTHVIFINAAKIVRYSKNPPFRTIVNRADLLLADGVSVSGRRVCCGVRCRRSLTAWRWMQHNNRPGGHRPVF